MEVRTGRAPRPPLPTTDFSTVNLDQPVPIELKSLSFDDIEFSTEAVEKLLDVVAKMCDLSRLTMRWCRVPDITRRADFEDLVENVVWVFVT